MTLEDKLTLGHGCCVVDGRSGAVTKGTVTIGKNSIVHPNAQILAQTGPIVIGDNNIIEENAVISNLHEPGHTFTIGNNNYFQVGCRIEAKSIGNNCTFDVKCFVGPEVSIGNGCVIGARCELTSAEIVPDRTCVQHGGNVRFVLTEEPPMQGQYLECVRANLLRMHQTKVSQA